MASWLPSSIQKRLLRYALLRSGFLDTQELDLDTLDITLGRQNNIELRDVGLNVEKLTSLLELPPELRLESARVLRLKLSVPADLYYGSITTEAQGVDCRLALVDAAQQRRAGGRGSRDQERGSVLPHRKTQRRIGRSPPFDPGGESRVPTTQDLARSFLLEEPREEVHELEEQYISQSRRLPRSRPEDTENDDALGTGTTPGLPGFLAGFLQGIVDRFKFRASDISARLSLPLSINARSLEEPFGMILTIASVDVGQSADQASSGSGETVEQASGRRIEVKTINVYIEGLRATDPGSPILGRRAASPDQRRTDISPAAASAAHLELPLFGELPPRSPPIVEPPSRPPVRRVSTSDPLEIRAGEDNFAWNYRRSESGKSGSDVWSGLDQPADLMASITADEHLSGSLHDRTRRRAPPVLESPEDLDDAPMLLGAKLDSSLQKDPPTDDASSSHDSNQESQSMYMSAYNELSQSSTHAMSQSRHQVRPQLDTVRPSNEARVSPMLESEIIGTLSEHTQGIVQPVPTGQSGAGTPLSKSLSDAKPPRQPQRTQVVHVNHVYITLGKEALEDRSSATGPELSPAKPTGSPSAVETMPGAFSVYAEQSASVRFEDPRRLQQASSHETEISGSRGHISLAIGTACIAFNIYHLASLLDLSKTVSSLFTSKESASKKDAHTAQSDSPPQPMSVEHSQMHFCLLASDDGFWDECMKGTPSSKFSSNVNQLLSMALVDMRITVSPQDSADDWTVDIGTFTCHVGNQRIMHFSDKLNESKRSVYLSDSDIRLQCSHLSKAGQCNSIIQYTLQTKQIELALPLDKIEDTFSSYGGISSLLELSSTLSRSDAAISPVNTPVKKGVRFETQAPQINGNEIKVNARLGGVYAMVSSHNTSFKLTTSAIKAVTRPDFIAIAVDNAQIMGPLFEGVAMPVKPIDIIVSGLRFEYLFHPMDADLDRLLSLLTPSKNKYENDDDILIDTLLRQRRKGSVVRLTLTSLRGKLEEWECLSAIQNFGNDLAGLAAVTKYLPEDDRPGLLTLIRIADTQVQIPVNDDFGSMQITLEDVNVAQVGLPSLLALSVNQVKAGGRRQAELLHPLMTIGANEELPMLMARLIGDEVEPTLRIKLFNLCAEYSIPTIITLMGKGTDINAEQVVDAMASTVLDLATIPFDSPPSPSSITSSATKSQKKLNLDVLLHDCMFGLQPQGLESKAMFVFNNSKISTVVPPKEKIGIAFELRKASMFVRDRAPEQSPAHEAVRIVVPERLSDALIMDGYVSVVSIMTARIDLQIIESTDKSTRSVEMDIRNELFLLESCADSTQTLIKTLGALSPPSPPSKEQKYRVEAMTMDDMVSSFSGDAFEKPPGSPTTIFDADMPAPPDEDDLIDASMTESIYGALERLDDPEDELYIDDDRARTDIAESLIDEDPFEIPDNPNAAKLSNKDLTKELNKQMSASNDSASTVIVPSLLSGDQIDQLSGESTVLGALYRWNTPNTKHPAIMLPEKRSIPFKLRLRDFHIIFNMYDGYDWQGTRQTITQAVEEVETKAEERRLRRRSALDDDEDESVIGDCLFNSIYIGVPTSKEAQDLRRQINKNIDDLASETESYATSGVSKPTALSATSGQRQRRRPRRLRLERSKVHKIAFELRGVSADILVFPSGEQEVQNTIDVRVRDLEIFDNLPTSTWRKFMTSWHKDNEEREMAKPMMHIEVQNVRPVKELSATELVMCVTVTPIRLHVDQDALDFMTRFFDFKDTTSPSTAPDPADQPFLQRVEVHTVDLCLDYKPKRVDYAGLRSGRYTEFKNFFILDSAHVVLKHAILYGIRGFEPLHDTLNDIWMPDIKRNQLPRVLSGLATVSPLVSLGQGVAGVVSVPIAEYRRNGRVVRSIQKGAVHLVRDTTSEIARFGARVAVGTQNLLTNAEAMLGTGTQTRQQRRRSGNVEGWTDVGEDDEREGRVVSSYANQPLGVLQGLKSARRHLERDLLLARDAIIAVQGEVMESESAGQAAQAVFRHAPTVLLRPVIGASTAVGQTLLGVGNQVDRANVKKVEDKYKQR